MKKSILFLAVIFICISGKTQERVFKSNSGFKSAVKFETTFVERDITINDKQIIITNVLNGGKEPLILNIEKTQEKEFDFKEGMLWYYCKSTHNDPVNGYSKYIVIMSKSKYPQDINVFQFADEVTVFRTNYTLK